MTRAELIPEPSRIDRAKNASADTTLETGGEFPSSDQLKALGELTFLYFRAANYQHISTAQLRSLIQPAIDTGFFAIMRHGHIPRGAFTFARLDQRAEDKLIRGEFLTAQEWMSGERVWLLDMIAPYGQGSVAKLMRFWHQTLPPEVNCYNAQRWRGNGDQLRRFTATRRSNGRWGSRIWENPYRRPDGFRADDCSRSAAKG